MPNRRLIGPNGAAEPHYPLSDTARYFLFSHASHDMTGSFQFAIERQEIFL